MKTVERLPAFKLGQREADSEPHVESARWLRGKGLQGKYESSEFRERVWGWWPVCGRPRGKRKGKEAMGKQRDHLCSSSEPFSPATWLFADHIC